MSIYNGAAYKISHLGAVNYFEALELSRASNDSLASILTSEEDKFLKWLIRTQTRYVFSASWLATA